MPPQYPPQGYPQQPMYYGPPSGFNFGEFLGFRQFMAASFVPVLFWIGFGVCILSGVFSFIMTEYAMGSASAWLIISGILYILVGPIVVRALCEVLLNSNRNRQALDELRGQVQHLQQQLQQPKK